MGDAGSALDITLEDFLQSPLDPGKLTRERKKRKVTGEAQTAQTAITEEQSRATSEAGRKERERRLRTLGRSGTVITGGKGLTEKAVVQRKVLLGE